MSFSIEFEMSHNGEYWMHLNVWIGEHVGIFTLTKKSWAWQQLRSQSFTILQIFIILWQFYSTNTWDQQNALVKTERESLNKDRSNIF